MSISVINAVFDGSQSSGSERCVLLAIASHANDAGVAWPGVKRLAKLANIDPRSVQRALSSLVATGELVILRNVRDHGCNEYRIRLDVLRAAVATSTPDTGVTPDTHVAPDIAVTPDASVTPDIGVGVTGASPNPDASVVPPLTQVPPEPSLNRQEQSAKRARRSAISLRAYLDQCKAEGRDPIPATANVFNIADLKGISQDLVLLAWSEFKRHHLPGGRSDTTKKKDWPAHFRNAVDGNWYRLWWPAPDGGVVLSSEGKLAKKLHDSLAAAHHDDRMAA